MTRVLAVQRISRDTETSSALSRQDKDLTLAIQRQGHEEVGRVVDATISGAVNLDQRPSLKKWLVPPLLHEWDALMVTTQDRITRDDMHWWQFVGWVLENGKSIVILDDPSFGIDTEDGRMIAGIKATQAAKYRKEVQAKKLKQTQDFREERLWSGGIWPFGYRTRTIEHRGEPRKRLVRCPVASALVREAYERIVNGSDTVYSVVRDWNARGVPSARDHQRRIQNQELSPELRKPERETRWAVSPLRKMLQSPALLGTMMFRSQPVIGADGLPVVWTEPILLREEYDALQERIRSFGMRSAPRSEKERKTSLLGVVFCVCGAPLYERTQRSTLKSGERAVRDYYTCRTVGEMDRCPRPASWRAETLRDCVEKVVLSEIGDKEITRRTFMPGHDRTTSIDGLRKGMQNLTLALSTATTADAVAAITRQMDEHSRTIASLEEEPVIRSRWIEEPTGRTYRAEWEARGAWEQKANILHSAGVRAYFTDNHKGGRCHVFFPDHFRGRGEDAEQDACGAGWPEGHEAAARAFLVEWRESLGLDGLIWRSRRSARDSSAAGGRAGEYSPGAVGLRTADHG
ncbi:recombinase family protein [Streptomyces sp. NPDC001815]|uniref:recombinase family protein n=1 Tax=unclassified Streptomyces TaxID=2593676 RepID=UPI00332E1AFB